MTHLEIVAATAPSATILGVFLTLYGIINNKTLKREERLTREMINKSVEKLDKSIAKIAELIVADGERTRELIRELKSAKG